MVDLGCHQSRRDATCRLTCNDSRASLVVANLAECCSWSDSLKHPVLMVLTVGALMFGADAYRGQQDSTVVVDASVRERLSALWLAQTGKTISPEELDGVVQSWVKEEVFYREAISLGLDEDDSIICRRLVQKLNFLIDETHSPSAEQIQVFYQENIASYSLPPRFSFSQILLADPAAAGVIKRRLASGEKSGQPATLDGGLYFWFVTWPWICGRVSRHRFASGQRQLGIVIV